MKRTVPVMLTIAGVLIAAAPATAERELKVTPALERSVSRGLEYLARTQKSDGSWQSGYGQGPGVVGLAVLAFLAHGEMPHDEKYGLVIRRGVDYIIKSQAPNGLLGRGGSPMYNHGFATLALAEVYGQIDDDRVGPALQKAVGLILASQKQNPQGAWRYSVNSNDADTTVSGAQMLALRAAASAGIEVPAEAIRKGVKFYMSCYTSGGGFGYTGPGGPNHARSGIGLLVLSLCGAYQTPQAKSTAEWLYNRTISPDDHYFGYAAYYCSQAMYQAGGKYWRQWNETVTPMLIRMQGEDGSWSGARGPGGGVLNTAFCLLAMEINYNFLPIYQR